MQRPRRLGRGRRRRLAEGSATSPLFDGEVFMSDVTGNGPSDVPARVQECSDSFKDVQKRSDLFTPKLKCETKPTTAGRTAGPLGPRQLAAARALARGYSTRTVAARLGTTVQTINRWRRTPGFAQELRHLHNLLAIPSKRSQPLVPSRAACLPRRRPIDVGDPDLNDFINRSIGRR